MQGFLLSTVSQVLQSLNNEQVNSTITQIQRGIEREALRVSPSGKLSQQPHPHSLGAALTNSNITTDYSEALLELITPPSNDINTTFAQLKDVHNYVLANIGDEMLWPMSMPCFIANQDEIPIAQYGSSNVGKMKTTYRMGLKHRYGSMMQAISGIHYNFSLPNSFWDLYQQQLGKQQQSAQEFKSEQYMKIVRNVKRYVWLITYMFGASPAMCKSFVEDKSLLGDFEEFGKGSICKPNATSLRMSDLGYTNSAQSALNIEYGSLTQYIAKLRQAIQTKSAEYQHIGIKENGHYKQLNDNILQIENELYAPVRPKQVAASGEKPTDALASRGVEYIEFRALDVNPFAPYGITLEQMRILDLFLVYCLVCQDDELTDAQQIEAEENQNKVVETGRDKNLLLTYSGESISREQWMSAIYQDLTEIAAWFDDCYQSNDYQMAVEQFKSSVTEPDATLSGTLLTKLTESNTDNGYWGLEQANVFKSEILNQPTSVYSKEALAEQAELSHQAQKTIENNDKLSFDEFLNDYFSN